MKNSTACLNLAALSLALAAVFTVPASAAAKPDGDQILRQASAKLAAAHQFSFKAHREIDAALRAGTNLPESADIEVFVLRPNKLMGVAHGKNGERRVYADGNMFSVVDAKMNLYATVPMHTSLDGLVDKISEKYGFTPPLAEFVLSDPYKEFRRQARTVTLLGNGTLRAGFLNLASVECNRLKLSGHGVDAELWVGTGDHLIRKLVATFNDRPGKPQIRIDFPAWNLAANANAGKFKFTPSNGAMRVPMRTTAEMAGTRATKSDKMN